MTYLENKSKQHVIINCVITGVYSLFMLIFGIRLYKIDSFDKTSVQSYLLKGLSVFMVLT